MMIGNNNFYFNYNNFLLNNNNFISPSQNVGINNIPKKPDNTSKTNIDNSSFSFDSTHIDTQDKSIFYNFSNSLSDFAGLNNTQSSSKNTQQINASDITNIFDSILYPSHDDKNYNGSIKKVDKYKDTISESADRYDIDSGLLYGILVAEQMRISSDDKNDKKNDNASKGFSQITVDAAIQGENFIREKNGLNELTKTQREDLKKVLSKELCDNDNLNIKYAAKYLSYLQSQFPLSNKLNSNDQTKLIAAAYKAGPEAVKNARMQEQLNDLLNLKDDKKLTTDGDIGGKTKDAISSFINSLNKNKKDILDINILNKLPSAITDYSNGNYSKIKEVIDLIWEKKYPDRKNLPGAVPIYDNVANWRADVSLSVEDVLKAQSHFLEDILKSGHSNKPR